jgi:3',5'-cyclic AMP phosphodiesterase CpdA
MADPVNRRSFLKFTGMSIGVGTLFTLAPPSFGAAAEYMNLLGKKNGEVVTPFSFVQLSDAHVGFNGPPDPLGTKAFERAVELVNALPTIPDLILFTGDLIHDTEDKDVQATRIKLFKEITARLKVPKIKYVPGEHDAGLDGGTIYRESFGESHYSFDHRGIHFIALDNVSRAKPEIGPEQIAWLKKDLSRLPKTAPIVVFTHRPLFDLKPEWEWFTSDGDVVMNILAPYQNVTVLYGHIHREHDQTIGTAKHHAARSLIFAFPDPDKVADKKPMPFDKDQPFKNLGIRVVSQKQADVSPSLKIDDVELTLREYSGINGIQQISKEEAL